MVLMASMDLPVRVIREQVASAMNLVIHQTRLRDGSRHIVQISEIVGRDGDTIVMQDIFVFEYAKDRRSGSLGHLRPTGIVPQFASSLQERGIELPAHLFQDQR